MNYYIIKRLYDTESRAISVQIVCIFSISILRFLKCLEKDINMLKLEFQNI